MSLKKIDTFFFLHFPFFKFSYPTKRQIYKIQSDKVHRKVIMLTIRFLNKLQNDPGTYRTLINVYDGVIPKIINSI